MPEEELNTRTKQMLVSSLMLKVSAPAARLARKAVCGGGAVKTNKRPA